jgi:hypothetical protein
VDLVPRAELLDRLIFKNRVAKPPAKRTKANESNGIGGEHDSNGISVLIGDLVRTSKGAPIWCSH